HHADDVRLLLHLVRECSRFRQLPVPFCCLYLFEFFDIGARKIEVMGATNVQRQILFTRSVVSGRAFQRDRQVCPHSTPLSIPSSYNNSLAAIGRRKALVLVKAF
ncbi:MAG TPA: hypothetical protein VGR03_03100, partial [Candidatus Acidoferrum sp.]|nr:hypothetical protein [Candidatus Acidoferrum sp.]